MGPGVKTTVESRTGTAIVRGPAMVGGTQAAPICGADTWSVGSFGDHLDLSSSKQRLV